MRLYARRPMGGSRKPLERMGAKVELIGAGMRADPRYRRRIARHQLCPPGCFRAGEVVRSAGRIVRGGRNVKSRAEATRDHTERLLRRWASFDG